MTEIVDRSFALALCRISEPNAARVCADIDLDEEAVAMPSDGLSSGRFLESLVADERFTDSIKFLSRALPKRLAVWWACACVRDAAATQDDSLAPRDEGVVVADGLAIAAAELWVVDPNEKNRRAAMDAAEATAYETAAGWAAAAAAWSGTSLAPPDVDDAPPPENLTAKAVSAALFLAAASGEPEQVRDLQSRIVDAGIEIASGRLRSGAPFDSSSKV